MTDKNQANDAPEITIVRPQEVSSEWLTKVLRANGIEVVVDAFEMSAVGTGQLGETRRFALTYRGPAPAEAPKTVVGKFPSDNDVACKTGKDMGFYRAEVMFYREAAARAKIRTPRVYFARMDEQSGEFTLLFEDLAPATQGDQMSGMAITDARDALSEAAKLHAAFWNDEEVMNQPWMYVPPGAQGFYTTELVESSWQHFEKTYAHRMDPEVIKVCDKFVRHHAAWNAPRAAPKCYSHNDFRADNMLFGDGRVAVVDWQTSNFLGTGMDIAYFLGGAFKRETRQAHEQQLLRHYYDELVHNGVNDYPFEQMMDDYRHYSFAVLVVAIAATVIVKQTERGDRLFMHMVNGGAYQALDNDALDLLPT
ncbi:MAG: oxidoreductase family protein [Pseudomonadota bacterium]